MNLAWMKDKRGLWFSLEGVDLSKVLTDGVYLIWHEGNPGRVVRVGQGGIAERLQADRADPAILGYKKDGELLVTWAFVAPDQRDGVERYLADTWCPLVGARYPEVLAIAVSSPFA